MSKMAELSAMLDSLSDTATQLTRCGEELTKAVSAIREAFSESAPEKKEAEPAKVKKPEVTVTKEHVRKALAELAADPYNRPKDAKKLLADHGAKTLSDLSEEFYADVLKKAEELKNA
ncbi:MAG: hypothetical protein DUD30_00820 [Lactobacillus sp.]|nr:MAG: hypothetical protein DUD30_00820 [Lactobacillus sp.]